MICGGIVATFSVACCYTILPTISGLAMYDSVSSTCRIGNAECRCNRCHGRSRILKQTRKVMRATCSCMTWPTDSYHTGVGHACPHKGSNYR